MSMSSGSNRQDEGGNQENIKNKTVFMAGDDVVATSTEQITALLRDKNFGRSVIPEHIVLAKKLSAVETTNAERINLLQVVSHNISNLHTHLWSFQS
jgi:hypothetical protein